MRRPPKEGLCAMHKLNSGPLPPGLAVFVSRFPLPSLGAAHQAWLLPLNPRRPTPSFDGADNMVSEYRAEQLGPKANSYGECLRELPEVASFHKSIHSGGFEPRRSQGSFSCTVGTRHLFHQILPCRSFPTT